MILPSTHSKSSYGFSSRPERNVGLHNDLQDLKPCGSSLNTLWNTQCHPSHTDLLAAPWERQACSRFNTFAPSDPSAWTSSQLTSSFICLPQRPHRRGLSGSSYVEQKPLSPALSISSPCFTFLPNNSQLLMEYKFQFYWDNLVYCFKSIWSLFLVELYQLYKYAAMCLPVHLMIVQLGCFQFMPARTKMLWTFFYKSFCRLIF